MAPEPINEAGLRALLACEETPDVARGLLGCRIAFGQQFATIVETEAYHESEPACHGYLGRTGRAEKLRRPPGHAYVYLSYGIHRLVNVVCGSQQVASGVLIRGVEVAPAAAGAAGPRGVAGPGRVGTLLDATLDDDGTDLLDPRSRWQLLPAVPGPGAAREIVRGPRIGISKAVELPWRFWVAGSPGVSRPR